jgi:hypothetical protein
MKILREAIKDAGGIPMVAYCCHENKRPVTMTDVQGWIISGLPKSELEWEGSNYAFVIASMDLTLSDVGICAKEQELLKESFGE